MIPFLDVGAGYRELSDHLDREVLAVLRSGWYVHGDACRTFEERFAEWCGTEYAVGVGNGLDALTLLLRAHGIGSGDEVLVSAHTFIATWLSIAQVGAQPVPIDAEPVSMNMDPGLLESQITSRTRAIVGVHLYGNPANWGEVARIAGRYGLFLVEDAAQAHGARVGLSRAGALGNAAAFSFYPGKNLGAAGDGGAITTNDPELARRVRALANYGSEVKYRHDFAGVNSRLDELQAAVLGVKLGVLDDWNARRAAIASLYRDDLRDAPGLTLPATVEGTTPSWHLFVVRHQRRDALRAHLALAGIDTQIHYPVPNHRSGAFHAAFPDARLPVTEGICRTCLSLPIGPHLPLEAARQVATAIRDFTD